MQSSKRQANRTKEKHRIWRICVSRFSLVYYFVLSCFALFLSACLAVGTQHMSRISQDLCFFFQFITYTNLCFITKNIKQKTSFVRKRKGSLCCFSRFRVAFIFLPFPRFNIERKNILVFLFRERATQQRKQQQKKKLFFLCVCVCWVLKMLWDNLGTCNLFVCCLKYLDWASSAFLCSSDKVLFATVLANSFSYVVAASTATSVHYFHSFLYVG